MSAGQTESQTALLRARYSKILKGININDLAVELNRQDLLSCTEKDVVLKSLSGIKKHRELCKALAAKGTSQVGLLSRAIKEFQETPPTSKGKESKQEMEFMARKPLVVKSQEEHHKEGFSGREEAEGKHGYVFRENGGKANRSRSERANGVEDTTSRCVCVCVHTCVISDCVCVCANMSRLADGIKGKGLYILRQTDS